VVVSSSGRGGGIFFSGNSLNLRGSIVAMNTGASGPDISFGTGKATLTYSLIGDKSGTSLSEAPLGSPDANGNLIGGPVHGTIDPKLGPMVYNGGPIFLDGSNLPTRALLTGSPAINAGDPTAVAGVNGVPLNDQRGVPFARVYGGRIDIGAVESQPNPLPGDFNLNGVVDLADYSLWSNAHTTFDPRADANGDGRVDDADLAVWRANFGHTYASATTGIAVATKSAQFAPSKMMADTALADPIVGPTRVGIGVPLPAMQLSVLQSSNSQARARSSMSASDAGLSSDQLLTLAAANLQSDLPKFVVGKVRRRDFVDWLTDSTDSETTALDEAFATLSMRNSLVRSP
jgi:hypothetical protein